jgi:hypothetical protein
MIRQVATTVVIISLALVGCTATDAPGGASPATPCTGYRTTNPDGSTEAKYCVHAHDIESLDLEVQQAFAELGDDIDTLSSKIDAVQKDAGSLSSDVAALSTKLDALETKLTSFKLTCTGDLPSDSPFALRRLTLTCSPTEQWGLPTP